MTYLTGKIPVSHIALAYRCPVYLYHSKKRGNFESERTIVCKQVASHLGEKLDPVTIWNEIKVIMPDISNSMENFCLECIVNCNTRTWESYSEAQVSVKSENFGITGVIDKLNSTEHTFAISRSSAAPETGVWKTDALRICAYNFCVEETTGWSVKKSRVEYIPSGVMREWKPNLRDRRTFLRLLATVKKIEKGSLPGKPHGVHCLNCEFKGLCGVGDPVRLSDLLR